MLYHQIADYPNDFTPRKAFLKTSSATLTPSNEPQPLSDMQRIGAQVIMRAIADARYHKYNKKSNSHWLGVRTEGEKAWSWLFDDPDGGLVTWCAILGAKPSMVRKYALEQLKESELKGIGK